jgi:hypothetical protein
MNLMLGAAVKTRINWIRSQGVELPVAAMRFDPLQWEEIQQLLNE